MNDKSANRQFFRLSGIELPAEFKVVQEVFDIASHQFQPTQIRDISAGGLSFIADKKVDLEQEVQIKVTLQDETLNLLGQVMRCHETTEDGQKLFEIGVKYIAIDRSEQDKIVGYIFQKQLEQRRRGFR